MRNHSNKNEFDLHENGRTEAGNSFSYEWFRTTTRFDTEVTRNGLLIEAKGVCIKLTRTAKSRPHSLNVLICNTWPTPHFHLKYNVLSGF